LLFSVPVQNNKITALVESSLEHSNNEHPTNRYNVRGTYQSIHLSPTGILYTSNPPIILFTDAVTYAQKETKELPLQSSAILDDVGG